MSSSAFSSSLKGRFNLSPLCSNESWGVVIVVGTHLRPQARPAAKWAKPVYSEYAVSIPFVVDFGAATAQHNHKS